MPLSERWINEAQIVLQWYPTLLRKSELAAYKNLALEDRAAAEKSNKIANLIRASKSTNKEASKELQDGLESFLKRTLQRVVSEHTRCAKSNCYPVMGIVMPKGVLPHSLWLFVRVDHIPAVNLASPAERNRRRTGAAH
jgi:hypothetical protein